MNKYQKLAEIERLLNIIKWPDDAEIYYTTANRLNGKNQDEENECGIGIYISAFNRDRTGHDEFGKYFSSESENLSDTLIALQKEMIKRGIKEETEE
jgi:predicted HTH domain antitoxin